MADGQVPETTAGAADTSAATGGATSAAAGTEKFDAEYVRQLRDEAAKHRTEKALAQAELKKLQDAQLSDAERQSKRLAELEAAAQRFDADKRDLQARLTVEREARKLGVIDEDAAYRLLDSSKLKFDDDGRPTNAGDLLKDLVKERPYLSGQAPQANPGTSATNPARSRGDAAGTFSRAQISDVTFYRANRDAILAAVRDGRIVD